MRKLSIFEIVLIGIIVILMMKAFRESRTTPATVVALPTMAENTNRISTTNTSRVETITFTVRPKLSTGPQK